MCICIYICKHTVMDDHEENRDFSPARVSKAKISMRALCVHRVIVFIYLGAYQNC